MERRSRTMARDCVSSENRIDMVKDLSTIRIEESGIECSDDSHEIHLIRDGDPLSAHAEPHDGDERIWSEELGARHPA
ncbi:MAG: hypothetical protein OXI95_10820 [bacterium]|nr:hypothetical protein [bacterium]